jgi:hypothetical protein
MVPTSLVLERKLKEEGRVKIVETCTDGVGERANLFRDRGWRSRKLGCRSCQFSIVSQLEIKMNEMKISLMDKFT